MSQHVIRGKVEARTASEVPLPSGSPPLTHVNSHIPYGPSERKRAMNVCEGEQ